MTREEQWMENYKALKAFVKENGHFAPKNTTLSNWTKYQRRRINHGQNAGYADRFSAQIQQEWQEQFHQNA